MIPCNEAHWARVRCNDDKVHHVDLATGEALCQRPVRALAHTIGFDAYVTCSLCACLWRNVYPPVRYLSRPA